MDQEENRLLETMPDVELARRLKRGITGIEQRRLKLGISFRLSGSAPRPAVGISRAEGWRLSP